MIPNAIDFVEYGDMTDDRRETIRSIHSRMIKAGFIDKETIDAAEEEAAQWIKNPCAMNYWTLTFASGRVGT